MWQQALKSFRKQAVASVMVDSAMTKPAGAPPLMLRLPNTRPLSERDGNGHTRLHADVEVWSAQIHLAVTHMAPKLDGQWLHLAEFNKELLEVGEIGVVEYITRLSNLFPERMDKLPAALKRQATRCIHAWH